MTTLLDVRNPRTGEVDQQIAVLNPDEIASTCAEVREASSAWQALGLPGRTAALRKLGKLIANDGELLQALIADTGREAIARLEISLVAGMVDRLAKNASAVLAAEKETTATNFEHITARTQLVPFTIVGIISPWNFPLLLTMMDSLQGLIAGCGVVAKPSEVAPRFVSPLTRLVNQVDILRSAFRIVVGPGDTGRQLINHVDAVVFTGSVQTGRKVAEAASRRFIPAFLELGGKDPAVVLPSADISSAAQTILRASVAATGQACQSLERVYVDRSKHDAFVSAMVAAAEKVEINFPKISKGHIGPFIMKSQADKVAEHIRDALNKGASLITGGGVIDHGGKWMHPTVLTNVNHSMKVMREETFGPVIPVMAYDSVEEAVNLANDSSYGLSGSVFAGDIEEAVKIAKRLNVGAVSINDGSLTSMVHEAEEDSFMMSGLGKSRMGLQGVARFFRKKALLINHGVAAQIDDYAERESRKG